MGSPSHTANDSVHVRSLLFLVRPSHGRSGQCLIKGPRLTVSWSWNRMIPQLEEPVDLVDPSLLIVAFDRDDPVIFVTRECHLKLAIMIHFFYFYFASSSDSSTKSKQRLVVSSSNLRQ
jgi:hypothetical protein